MARLHYWVHATSTPLKGGVGRVDLRWAKGSALCTLGAQESLIIVILLVISSLSG